MATPRELPILLCLTLAVGAVGIHVALVQLDRSQPRPEGPRVALLAAEARQLSSLDQLAIASVTLSGMLTIGTLVRARRRQVLGGASNADRKMLLSRGATVLVPWVGFAALALPFMLRRPAEEWLRFALPCLLLLGPLHIYLRSRDGEAIWAPWILWCALAVLAATRAPVNLAGVLLVALVCCACAGVQARQKHRQA